MKDCFTVAVTPSFPNLPTYFQILAVPIRKEIIFSLSDEIQMHSLSEYFSGNRIYQLITDNTSPHCSGIKNGKWVPDFLGLGFQMVAQNGAKQQYVACH
jgi:hypothetical protein